MKNNLLLIVFLLSGTICFSQFTMNTADFSASSAGGSSTISVSGDLNFNNSETNGNAVLILAGVHQSISSSRQRSISNVHIAGGGNKTFNGDFIISGNLVLQDGIVVPSGIFIMGPEATIDETNVGDASHVSGTLYRAYNGASISYPVGAGGIYTPVRIETATGTNPILGITANGSAPTVDAFPSGITDQSVSWSWQLNTTGDGELSSALLTLPFMAEDRARFGDDGYRPVVLYNETGQPTATLFNNSANASSVDNTVTAQDAGRTGTYFVGKELLFTPVINNIITPDENSMNDYLTITNLSLYPENKVKLIDRYGVVVYDKDNYVSPLSDSMPGVGEDFSFLAAGNYVCILEYKDLKSGETIKLRQGITVLR